MWQSGGRSTLIRYSRDLFDQIISKGVKKEQYYVRYEPFLENYVKDILPESARPLTENEPTENTMVAVITPSVEWLKVAIKKPGNILVLVVPQRTERFDVEQRSLCAGRQNEISIEAWRLAFQILDEGLTVLPLKNFFHSVFCAGSNDYLILASYALASVELLNGRIPHVRIHGKKSNFIYGNAEEMREHMAEEMAPRDAGIKNLIMIDRTMDKVTPLLMQGSVEGLVDDFLGIDCGVVRIPRDVPMREAVRDKWNIYKRAGQEMTPSEHLYHYIRYRMLDHAIPYLYKIANEIAPEHEKDSVSVNGTVIGQDQFDRLDFAIRDYVSMLDAVMKRAMSLNSYQLVKEAILKALGGNFWDFEATIRDLMYSRGCYVFAWQLMLLYCTLKDGVPQALLTEFKEEMLFQFGLDTAEQIECLEQIELLCKSTTISWSKVKRWFKLEEVSDGTNQLDVEREPTGFDGYVPLTVRMVQADLEQKPMPISQYRKVLGPDHYPLERDSDALDPDGATLVCFIGGVTELELSWLTWLSEYYFHGRIKISVMATEILTAERYIKQCLPFLKDEPSLREMTNRDGFI